MFLDKNGPKIYLFLPIISHITVCFVTDRRNDVVFDQSDIDWNESEWKSQMNEIPKVAQEVCSSMCAKYYDVYPIDVLFILKFYFFSYSSWYMVIKCHSKYIYYVFSFRDSKRLGWGVFDLILHCFTLFQIILWRFKTKTRGYDGLMSLLLFM